MVPDDGLQVVYESGLEVVPGTEPSTSNGGSWKTGGAQFTANRQSYGNQHASLPPPPYNAGGIAPFHDTKSQYSSSWNDGGENAPIPVSPTHTPPPHHKPAADDDNATLMAHRPEDVRRQQIAALQVVESERRIFGYRRKVFFAIFGTATVVSVIVIAVAISIGVKRGQAKSHG